MKPEKKSSFVHNQHGDLFSGYILRYIERRGADLLLPVLHCRRAPTNANLYLYQIWFIIETLSRRGHNGPSKFMPLSSINGIISSHIDICVEAKNF